MKSKRALFCILIIIVILVFILPGLFNIFIGHELKQLGFSKTMYTDISSLEFLEEHTVEGTVPVDSKLGDLSPTDSYIATVKYKNREYKVYAYVFRTIDGAREYYQNATGISDLMSAKGLYNLNFENNKNSEYCAYYENCAFRVEGEELSRLCKFMEWFGRDFPIDLTEEFYNEFGYYPPM